MTVRAAGEPTPDPTGDFRVRDAGADPESARTNTLTLRFTSPPLEAAFTDAHRAVTLRNARPAVGLGLVLVAVFGILDAVLQPAVLRELWLIRFGFITPVILVVLMATWIDRLNRYIEWLLLAVVVAAGLGILGMILISPAPGNYLYYAGLILVIIYNYTFLRLRFAVANVAGWAIVAAYLLAELARGQIEWPILVNNMFFFTSANVVGMFAAYSLEKLERQSFLQARLVRRARKFGSYRLSARIGEGGMGEVWRAEHQMLARPAAIKLIRPEHLGADDGARDAMVQRFRREAQATASLRSPHTVEVFDFGVTDDHTFYYVMELLAGYDAQTLVRDYGPLPPARVKHFLLQICESLGEAHEQGLIHRDIKPANVYVCRYGRDADFVKVLDFGIVKWNRGESVTDSNVTREGFAGTPSSVAPEQIAGDGPIDGRSDLYSLGCVAYFLLTGHQVFEAPTVVQVLASHLDGIPIPPSKHVQSIPAALERIVLQLLEKNPGARPATADELAELLRACDVGEWSVAQRRAWWAEHPPPLPTERMTSERTVVPTMFDRIGV